MPEEQIKKKKVKLARVRSHVAESQKTVVVHADTMVRSSVAETIKVKAKGGKKSALHKLKEK